MSFTLSNAVRYLEHPSINGTSKSVLRNLLDHSDDDGTNMYPSVETICKETGFDRKAVFRALGTLKATFLELCETVNLGGRIGKINKFNLRKKKFIDSINNEKEKERIITCLFKDHFARPQSGTSNPLASTQKGFARPQSGTQLNQYSIKSNTNYNNNTNHLGITKYLEEIPRTKANVVVPTEYTCFENLQKVEKKIAKPVEPLASESNVKQSMPASMKKEIEIEELPLSVVQKMKDVRFDGSYMRLRILKWVKQFGENYVLEKILLLRNTKFNKPGAILTEAIKWDWKEIPKLEKPNFPKDEANPFCNVVDSFPKPKPKLECGLAWWKGLNEEQRRKVVNTIWDKWTVNDLGYDARKFYYDSEAFLRHEHFRDVCKSYNKQPPEKHNEAA